jgi:heterotetrameric sarcosine oxidase gamma subunit
VASLIEKSACDGLLPVTVGAMTLTEAAAVRITSVAPFAGQDKAVAAALKTMGLGWPAPNRAVVKGDAACLWTGRGQAFLIGADPSGLDGIAALTDQSGAWAVMRMSGPGHEAALARLVTVDLRLAAFPVGHVARTGLNHMMAVLHRTAPDAITIMIFRSMAATAVHEITAAMQAVTARQSV